MERKDRHTLEELRETAQAQHLRIEEKEGKYRVVRTVSERFGLVVVKAGDGYSLTHEGLRKFLIFNSIDIGKRITDWSYTMNDTYDRKEAMARVGFTSPNAFFQLERKYPEAFVVTKRGLGTDIRYDKATLDQFAERHKHFNPERP
ncbi:MAG TPA: hypothetical protein VFM05_11140 [Candidatus Saccharimonadales bacterium]|nr:hypothetical protein [Candidatus Saccharimonadales bacterium]